MDILPSPQARKVYSMMVFRANDDLYLSLAQSIELSVTLQRRGEDAQARTEVAELREAAWIEPLSDGGWKLA